MSKNALIQLPAGEGAVSANLAEAFDRLLSDPAARNAMGGRALATMNSNRGAVTRTLEYISPLIGASAQQ